MVKIYGDNVVIDNLDVKGLKSSDYNVVPVGYRVCGGADHVTIKNCEVYNIGCDYKDKSNIDEYNAHGIIVSGEVKSAITDVTIDNCHVHNLTLGQSESLVLNGNVDGFKVINNLVENNDNIGIDLIGYEKQKLCIGLNIQLKVIWLFCRDFHNCCKACRKLFLLKPGKIFSAAVASKIVYRIICYYKFNLI